MDDHPDLIVAGAGPAGCVLAAKAAADGARVLLLEKKSEPGQDRDWIVDVTPETFGLAGVPEPEPDELFCEPETTALVTSDRSRTVELLPVPMVPVRNGPYVRRLASWAQSCGAELRVKTHVLGPLIESGAVRGLMVRDGRKEVAIRSTLVADCTGMAGSLRRGTPAEWGISAAISPEDVVLARRETRSVDVERARSAMEKGVMWDGIRYDRVASQGVYSVETFYLNIEEGFVDILIGVKPGSGPTPEERFDAICERYPFIGEKVFGDGGPIPIRRPLDTFVADGIVCAGDSACQVIPAHGSGTASAIIAADMASGVVLRAIETGRADRASLWGYPYAFQTTRGALLAYYDVMRRHTASLTEDDLNAMVAKGLVTPSDVYSGLVPEVPRIRAAQLAERFKAGPVPLRLLTGLAGAGLLAGGTLAHYAKYPPLDLPGALERWVASTPGGPAY